VEDALSIRTLLLKIMKAEAMGLEHMKDLYKGYHDYVNIWEAC